jgi:uncharacterized protein (DUF983 family)
MWAFYIFFLHPILQLQYLHFFGTDQVGKMQINSGLSAVWNCKCPRCWKGDVFAHSVFNYLKFNKTNSTCSHCGIAFEPEPGFYYGAMFVSYAITVALFSIVTTILYFAFHPSEEVFYFDNSSFLVVHPNFVPLFEDSFSLLVWWL